MNRDERISGAGARATSPTDKVKLEIVDAIEAALDRCEHPHVVLDGADPRADDVHWCAACGAWLLGGQWQKPHWRDAMLRALFSPTQDGPPPVKIPPGVCPYCAQMPVKRGAETCGQVICRVAHQHRKGVKS